MLECYFTLKRKKDKIENIKTKDQYCDVFIDLIYFVEPSVVFDDLILDCCSHAKQMCFIEDNDKIVHKNVEKTEQCYLVDFLKFESYISSLQHLNRLCDKYPKRLIDSLYAYPECSAKFSEADIEKIKNELYDTDTQLELPDVGRILTLYKFFSQFFKSGIEFDKYDMFYIRNE